MPEINVLIVDDEEAVLYITKALLEHLGYQVNVAHTAEAAIQILKNNHDEYQLIILDYKLPMMDGMECLEKIHEFCNIPVILTSGVIEEIDEKTLIQHGAQGLLLKPYTLNEIEAKLKEVLE